MWHAQDAPVREQVTDETLLADFAVPFKFRTNLQHAFRKDTNVLQIGQK